MRLGGGRLRQPRSSPPPLQAQDRRRKLTVNEFSNLKVFLVLTQPITRKSFCYVYDVVRNRLCWCFGRERRGEKSFLPWFKCRLEEPMRLTERLDELHDPCTYQSETWLARNEEKLLEGRLYFTLKIIVFHNPPPLFFEYHIFPQAKKNLRCFLFYFLFQLAQIMGNIFHP